jgi:cytochrome c
MSGAAKSRHIRIGAALSVMSWLTMAIITAILGFMMDPGAWVQERTLLSGFLNPLYVPQLFFRTCVAMVLAGSLVLALGALFTVRSCELRRRLVRAVCGWTLFWIVPAVAWALVYYRAVPAEMLANLPVAFGTQAWAGAFGRLLTLTWIVAAVGLGVNLLGMWRPGRLRAWVWLAPFVSFSLLMGQFERSRQFIRKPYVLAYYMYSNGVRVGDAPYLAKTGVLANSVWASHTAVTPENKVQAGRDVFMIACSRCHTLNGVNSITGNLSRMYPGSQPWQAEAIDRYVKTIHGARPYMPPFPGNAEERSALAAYLAALQKVRDLPDSRRPPVSVPPPAADTSAMDLVVPKDIPLALPAPVWLLTALLLISFALHIFFVNLMVGGSIITVATEILGLKRSGWDRVSHAIASTVTVNKSLAVVLGVAPLLTISVLYTVYFYAANTSLGFSWLMVIPLVIFAFLCSYAHEYSWRHLENNKALHIAMAGAAAVLFLAIPVIFLSNINLMLYPEHWRSVASLGEAAALPNVLPRYLHFLSATLALTGLFFAYWFGRRSAFEKLQLEDLSREQVIRSFYGLALGATAAQLFFGLLVFLTLPSHAVSVQLTGVLTVVFVLALLAVRWLWLEVRDPAPGRRFWTVAAVLSVVVALMVWARHEVRETAVRQHRTTVAYKTAEYQARVVEAQRYVVQPGGLGGEPPNPAAQAFTQRCGSCHSFDKRLVGPPLNEAVAAYQVNPEALAGWILRPGRKRPDYPAMPAQQIPSDELQLIVRYVLEKGTGEAGTDR